MILQRIPTLCVVILTSLVFYIFQSRAKAGKLPKIRTLPAVKALEEAVGRASEMGRPVLFNPGYGKLDSDNGPMIIAGLTILKYVSEICVRNGVRLITAVGIPEALAMIHEIIREAYTAGGKKEEFKPEDIIYVSNQIISYEANTISIMRRENVASAIMTGCFWHEVILLAEAGAEMGALQIGGSARVTNIPYFAILFDYSLLGEEIYAASAVISRDENQLGSIEAADILKVLVSGFIIVGSLLESLGIHFLTSVLGG